MFRIPRVSSRGPNAYEVRIAMWLQMLRGRQLHLLSQEEGCKVRRG